MIIFRKRFSRHKSGAFIMVFHKYTELSFAHLQQKGVIGLTPMASVAIIAGVLGGLLLGLIALGILLYCLCLRREVDKGDENRIEHQPESEYFETIDFAKIRKNNMHRDEHIRELNLSSETQISNTSKDLTSNDEYYDVIHGNTNNSVTADNAKPNSGVRTNEEKRFKYQSNCGYVNNTLVNDTGDGDSDTCDKQTPQIQEIAGKVDHCNHVIDRGTERENLEQYRTNSPEAEIYFILENTTSAPDMNENNISQTDISIVQKHNRDGKEPISDHVENVYSNQRKQLFDDRGPDEKDSDDMYFVLEKS